MRLPLTCLLVLISFNCWAQTDEDAEPLMTPSVLALDTTLSVANHFSDEISNVAPGYKFAFVDKGQSKTVKKIYKTDNNETLKIEYKYSLETEDTTGGKKPMVIFQRIIAEAAMMAKIYNFLFKTDITAAQLPAYSSTGMDIYYMGKVHQFIFQPDDYAPGYWMMSFVR